MLEWIITSCVLIGVVLLLRLCLKNRISLRLRYGLWLIVLVRLLVPVNFFSSPMSVLNALPEAAPVVQVEQPLSSENLPSQPVSDVGSDQVPILPVNPTPVTQQSPQLLQEDLPSQVQAVEEKPIESRFSVGFWLQLVWVVGMVITASVFLCANIRFALRLKRTRKIEHTDCPIPVYNVPVIDTPCLFGLVRPSIYLTQEAGEDEGRQHILIHELTHYKHLDHIWGLLRCLCLVLHWYNPLVWVAAVLSRHDGELACDEAVIRQLGEQNRSEYGKTLIRMTCMRQTVGALFTNATTMTGSKKSITQRIKLIAKRPKTAVYAVICLTLVAAITVGCTFTGAKINKEKDRAKETTADEREVSSDKTTVVVTDKRPEEVLTKSYKLEDLRAFMDDEEIFYTIYASHPYGRKLCLSDVHDKFPIECIKGKYIVYSVEEGGYFYVFMDIWDAYKVGKQVDLSDTYVNDTVYVSRVCDLSDYDSIEIGKSTNQDVIDIDPNTETGLPSTYDYEVPVSCSPLSDGRVIEIKYKRDTGIRSAIVADIQIKPIDKNYRAPWWAHIQYEDWPVDIADNTSAAKSSSIPTPKELPMEEAVSEFLFASGGGAWVSQLQLSKDGSFSGVYHDTEAGDIGRDYPNGTRYCSTFLGNFQILKQPNEYSIELKLSKLQTEQPQGKVWFENGMRYITTDALGIDGGERFILFLPNATIEQIPAEARQWLPVKDLQNDDQLGFYFLYNENKQVGFSCLNGDA